MQQVTMVITNCGDGSNSVIWFKGKLTNEQISELENYDPECFSSGDGFQETVYNFPDDFDFKAMGISEFCTVEEFLHGIY